ncbi:MAG: decarboxylating NADP(+)-dependent phosphogluconate dehydrogenase [Gemmatimonadota bacterium]|nr:decarboxylating NADP(+)-dependent phosphogluconate dehydrogenase [Gemmatimonadota bacterium]
MTADLGIVGLGTMGSNLALNASDEGFSVALLDADDERVRAFVEEHDERELVGTDDAGEFVDALGTPRRILLMVPAGDPVDAVLNDLAPLLDPKDIVVDGGNSHWEETERRGFELIERENVRFVGMGVSGGAAGARHGPSLMPGGPREAYDELEDALRAIAADSDAGPCVGYLGPDGAGHFVKMVHNGIEYADMQGIAEAYDLLSRGLGFEASRLAELFEEWNEGPLESFLIEITAGILRVRDEDSGQPLVERIVDEAAQKGTGRWTAIAALELGVPVPSIVAAVDARVISSRREERRRAEGRYGGYDRPIEIADADTFVRDVRDALLASRICAFAQGMDLIRHASGEHGWDVPLAEVARVWRAGCIIRSRLLDPIRGAFEREPDLENLLLDDGIASEIEPLQSGWRRAICASNRIGVPTPCWSASVAYFDAYRTARLPQYLTQAQRDWFGAHTYRRLDEPEGEPVHTDWASRAEMVREGEGG